MFKFTRNERRLFDLLTAQRAPNSPTALPVSAGSKANTSDGDDGFVDLGALHLSPLQKSTLDRLASKGAVSWPDEQDGDPVEWFCWVEDE